MNAVLYARVSTEKQADKELSIPAQLNAMREYARQRDWTIMEEFIEPGASARTTDRPALQRLLARCRVQPAIEALLVHKVDRLARDVYGHATIKALLKQRGIRLASVVENVDDSITGQLVENIMASIAEFYSANLGEEVKKGMRVMVQRGEWPHLPPRGYVQTRTSENRPLAVPDEVAAPAITEAFELYATGRYSLRELGEELVIRGVRTSTGRALPFSHIRSILENPFYAGRLRWNGADYPARHKAIVPEALFVRVQQVLRARFKPPGERGRARYLLRGLATCADCGYRVTAERHDKWSYYRCIRNTKGSCSAPLSNTTVAHAAVVALYRRLVLPPQLKESIRQQVHAERQRRAARARQDAETLRRRRDRLLAREVKLTEAFVAGDTSQEVYRSLGAKTRAEIVSVSAALEERLPVKDLVAGIERVLRVASSLADLHQTLDIPRQQRLLALVFDRLILDRGAIIDYALKAPFNNLLTPAGEHSSEPPENGSSSHLEQRPATPAIQSLFEFDFSALDKLLPAIASSDGSARKSI